MRNMLIGPTIISFLLPLQLHAHNIQNWHPEMDAFVHIARDSAGLIGLPSLANKFPVINYDQELMLREATKYDRPPKRRKLFVMYFVKQMRSIAP